MSKNNKKVCPIFLTMNEDPQDFESTVGPSFPIKALEAAEHVHRTG